MKNLLPLLCLLFVASCSDDPFTNPDINMVGEEMDSQEEEFDLAELEIFGTWELLDLGPLGCQGDHYTFNDDRTIVLEEVFDCDQIVFPSLFSRWWKGTENTFTILSRDPTQSLGLDLPPEEGKVYTIVSRDENNIHTTTPAGEILEANQWKRVE